MPVSPTPTPILAQVTTQETTDIPIDPALLEEEADMDDMEDAEGELVDEDELDVIGYGDEHDIQYRFPSQPSSSSTRSSYPQLPTKAPRVQLNQYPQAHEHELSVPGPSFHTPRAQPRKRDRQDRSTNGTPRLNGAAPSSRSKLVNRGNGKGRGKGKGDLLQTPYQTNDQHTHGVSREECCSFCGGTDLRNKSGDKERMVSCARCGRSGHPSCLNMLTPRLRARVMTYDWHCIECKTCECCQIKGDDSRLMFCDTCDRGWHSYCLDPPLAKPPKGAWHCPTCKAESAVQSVSLASTSKSHSLSMVPVPSSRKGKGRASHEDMNGQPTPTARVRKSGSARAASALPFEDDLPEGPIARIKVKIPKKERDKKGKGRGRTSLGVGVDTEDEGPPMIVRLRVPSGGGRKGTADAEATSEEEEEKLPYGGVIVGEDADTSRTNIAEADKEAFEKSRKAAEAKLGGPPPPSWEPGYVMSTPGSPAPSPGVFGANTPGKSTPLHSSTSVSRGLRDRLLQHSVSESSGFPFPATPTFNQTHSPSTPLNHYHHHHHHSQLNLTPNHGAVQSARTEKIKTIRFGQYEIDTWYSAPYPEEYAHVPEGKLWLCEFCLKYMKSGFVAGRHRLKCKVRHPPGDEIYRDGAVSVFEVDGRKNKIYCQNLCLLAKMFLDHKTLYYDVEPFLFYVMTEVDELGARFVGYFSKEKRSMDNNVSCIMTLPVRQRKGWGQLLIDFSYLLSKKEGRVGSPEKPLSGLGAVTYKGYWRLSVFRYLKETPGDVTMDDISLGTSMTLEDIYSILTQESMINILDSPPRETPSRFRGRGRGRGGRGGRSSVHRRKADSDSPEDEDVKLPTRYRIVVDREYVEAVINKYDSRGYLKLRPERLKYHPFLVTRNATVPPEEAVTATLQAAGLAPSAVHPDDHNMGEDEEGVASRLPGKPVSVTTPQIDQEAILHGEDRATLDLVATLSASPARSLRRKRQSEEVESPSKRSSRFRNARTNGTPNGHVNSAMLSQSPISSVSRRSLRGSQTLPIVLDDHDSKEDKGGVRRGIFRKSESFTDATNGSEKGRTNGWTSHGSPAKGPGLSVSRRKRIISSEAPEDDEVDERAIPPDSRSTDLGVNGTTNGKSNGHADGLGLGFGQTHENGVSGEAMSLANGKVENGHKDPARLGLTEPAVKAGDDSVDADADADGDIDAEGEDEDAEGEDDDDWTA